MNSEHFGQDSEVGTKIEKKSHTKLVEAGCMGIKAGQPGLHRKDP